jgi:hypothetical protein
VFHLVGTIKEVPYSLDEVSAYPRRSGLKTWLLKEFFSDSWKTSYTLQWIRAIVQIYLGCA